ncbi:MAG: PASTA domain-containing protein [Bacteroidia bacterium]
MSFFKFLISRAFWINVLIAIGLLSLLVFLFFQFLDSYTNHGESLTVPDLTGKSIEAVQETIEAKSLNFKVFDTVYISDLPLNTVIEQNPVPGSKVKRNRTIYLTMNSGQPAKVRLPNLDNSSVTHARDLLRNKKLKIGELEYVPHWAPNLVLGMKYKGRDITKNDSVAEGSVIDLVVGDGLKDSEITVPNLSGLRYQEAVFLLKGAGINIGNPIVMGSVTDTADAIVYRQRPQPGSGKIALGDVIDIWIMDPEVYELQNGMPEDENPGEE